MALKTIYHFIILQKHIVKNLHYFNRQLRQSLYHFLNVYIKISKTEPIFSIEAKNISLSFYNSSKIYSKVEP